MALIRPSSKLLTKNSRISASNSPLFHSTFGITQCHFSKAGTHTQTFWLCLDRLLFPLQTFGCKLSNCHTLILCTLLCWKVSATFPQTLQSLWELCLKLEQMDFGGSEMKELNWSFPLQMSDVLIAEAELCLTMFLGVDLARLDSDPFNLFQQRLIMSLSHQEHSSHPRDIWKICKWSTDSS